MMVAELGSLISFASSGSNQPGKYLDVDIVEQKPYHDATKTITHDTVSYILLPFASLQLLSLSVEVEARPIHLWMFWHLPIMFLKTYHPPSTAEKMSVKAKSLTCLMLIVSLMP
jgi:hypothetical protein